MRGGRTAVRRLCCGAEEKVRGLDVKALKRLNCIDVDWFYR